MRALRFVAALMIVVGLSGCGSGKDSGKDPAMPDVTGKKLDVAQSDIKRAGFEGKAEVLGGGVFGVIKESNWEVCEQTPAPGQPLTKAPRLKVDRECNKDDVSPSEEPSTKPSEADVEPILTPENNKEFATLLAVSDGCDERIEPFAAKYADRTIEFDGSIAAMAKHGHYDTRYDILL